MVGEQLAALIGLFVGSAIGASIVVAARRRNLTFPLVPVLFTTLSAAMAIYGLIERDLTVFFTGTMLALSFIYPPIWRAGNTTLRIAYSVLLIAVPALFIAVASIGVISRLAGILALVGIAIGIANIVVLAKH